MVDKVMAVQTGMTKDTIDSIFGVSPYNLLAYDSTGVVTYTYVYRTRHVKRFPIVMSRKSGLPAEGEFIDLNVTYDTAGVAIHIESCPDCPRDYLTQTDINPTEIIASITTIITVTVPALLVFLSTN